MKKETNLEYLKENKGIFNIDPTDGICGLAYSVKYKTNSCNCECNSCIFNNFDECVDFLMQEYKEPIKLKQWEYDILNYHNRDVRFIDYHFLMIMRSKGYFKGIDSVDIASMKIRDILENCEIISDDYNFGGNENE